MTLAVLCSFIVSAAMSAWPRYSESLPITAAYFSLHAHRRTPNYTWTIPLWAILNYLWDSSGNVFKINLDRLWDESCSFTNLQRPQKPFHGISKIPNPANFKQYQARDYQPLNSLAGQHLVGQETIHLSCEHQKKNCSTNFQIQPSPFTKCPTKPCESNICDT